MSSSSSRGIGRGKVQGEGGRGGKCKSEEKKRVRIPPTGFDPVAFRL